ncbi:MAG: SdiA-regulated domain-containing protein [Pseudomonadota bacterium]
MRTLPMILAAKGLFVRVAPVQWGMLLLVVALAYQVLSQQLDQRLYFWLTSDSQQDKWAGHSVWLPDFEVREQALAIDGIKNNLSGLVYDSERDRLWSVVNNPPELQLLSTAGELQQRYPLSGFKDVEDITYLGDDLLLLVEERTHALVVVPLPTRPGTLHREDYRALTLGLEADGNAGFEGVSYDRKGDRLYVVKEHSPRKLYEIQGLRASLAGGFNLAVMDRSAWIGNKVFATDLSAVHFDDSTGHLLLLSDESKLLMELSDEGELVSFRSLYRGFAGLEQGVPQAEGLTMDGRGNLYLVSEPNLFYRFSRAE